MPYPLHRLKPLKEEKSDPKPLNQDEVFRFLNVVADEWRDYYIVRFYTGMRSCEVHGLLIDCIDFEHGHHSSPKVTVSGLNASLPTLKPRNRAVTSK